MQIGRNPHYWNPPLRINVWQIECSLCRDTTNSPIPQAGDAPFATTTINYDVAGRKTSMVDPDMGAWSYAYDALSNLTRQTDAKNQRICLYYDGLNRVTGKHYRTDDTCPTANPTLNVSCSYDANLWGIGLRTGMADVSGSTAWSYDNRGRMTSEAKTITGAGTYTTAWTYTNADQVKTMTYPKSGEVVTSNYLPHGTLNSLTSSFGSTYLTSAAVDAAGRATVFNLGNGTQTIYTYNTWAETDGKQSGRLKKLQSGTSESLTAGAPSLQSFEYAYDWAGNITDITQKVGSQSVETPHYDYDEINRLTSVTYGGNPTTTTYDANTGNLATKASKTLGYGTQAANCPGGALTKVHAVTSLDGTTNTYCYDANGNMTRRTIGTNIYNLSYDPENRLTQISGGGGPVFDYVYDGDGQRVMVKQTTGTQTDKTIYIGGYFEVFIKASYTAPATPPALNCGTRRCIYFPLGILPNNPVAATGQVWKSYYSTGSGRAMRVQDNAGGGGSGLFWLYADHLGSTTATANVNGDGGISLSTLSYTAWGETRASSGATPTSIRYTGQREAEAGLYFYQARWYDPALGRFAQADTIIPGQDAISFDRYSYVRNNPINFNDPTGHIEACEENCRIYSNDEMVQALRNMTSTQKRIAIQQYAISLRAEQKDSLEAFKDLLNYAGSLYNTTSLYTPGTVTNFVRDVTCVIIGYCDGSPGHVWHLGFRQQYPSAQGGIGYVGSPEFFKGQGGWADQYNDFSDNQMYHFWFYVAVTYWNGPIFAYVGDFLHDPGFDLYLPADDVQPVLVVKGAPWVTPGNNPSGTSQQDYLLGLAGIKFGLSLSLSIDVSGIGNQVKNMLGK
jgi:RHS repeat-associated protein